MVTNSSSPVGNEESPDDGGAGLTPTAEPLEPFCGPRVGLARLGRNGTLIPTRCCGREGWGDDVMSGGREEAFRGDMNSMSD